MEDEEEGVLANSDEDPYFNGVIVIETWRDSKNLKHRIGGPAVVYDDGDLYWYKHGDMHRVGAPARVWPMYGIEEWYIDGNLHREDGPAFITLADGILTEDWYKNGEPYEPSAHELILWKMKKEKTKKEC